MLQPRSYKDVNITSMENELSESTNISDSSKEYIPVCVLDRFVANSNTLTYLRNTAYGAYFSSLNESAVDSNLTLFIGHIFNQLLDGSTVELEELEILNSEIQGILFNYCENGESKFKDKFSLILDEVNRCARMDTYESILNNNVSNSRWMVHPMRTKNFVSNYMYLMDTVNNKVAYALCIKSKYLEYYRMCVLLNRTPNPKIFTLFVDPFIESKSAEFKYLRSKYKSRIEAPLIENNVEKVVVDNIFELLTYTKKIPAEIKTISARREWLEEVKGDFMIFERNRLMLLDKNIKLEVA